MGLEEAVRTLAERLGPNKTLISNYPTPDAMKLCVGGMMERGGSTEAIAAFGKKTCGLYDQLCLLDYHAQVRLVYTIIIPCPSLLFHLLVSCLFTSAYD